ncbi:hypothetical protein D5S17_23830 [Pseudonocardiaceae bacterium YIM PH 21723]|nr:hypothetical protein D5S17_23830 [Pseudonocardiaceae bacterium YIM PH 21723]
MVVVAYLLERAPAPTEAGSPIALLLAFAGFVLTEALAAAALDAHAALLSAGWLELILGITLLTSCFRARSALFLLYPGPAATGHRRAMYLASWACGLGFAVTAFARFVAAGLVPVAGALTVLNALAFLLPVVLVVLLRRPAG